jgi:hypothetical protein
LKPVLKSLLALATVAAIGLAPALPASAARIAPAASVTASKAMPVDEPGSSPLYNPSSPTQRPVVYAATKKVKFYVEVGKTGPAKGAKAFTLEPQVFFPVKSLNKTWGLYTTDMTRGPIVVKHKDLRRLEVGLAKIFRTTVRKDGYKHPKGETIWVAGWSKGGYTYGGYGWMKTADLKAVAFGRYTTVRATKVYDDVNRGVLASVKKGTKVDVRKVSTTVISGKKVKVAVLATGNLIPLKDLKKSGSNLSKLK